MDSDKEYYEHLLSSKASPERAKANREISGEYFWGIFKKRNCTKVLDAGCGVGHFMLAAPKGISISGVDRNKYMVGHCKKLGLAAKQADVSKTGFPEGSFDGIFCSHVLEHLENPGEAMEEFRRLLAPGGVFVARVPHPKFFHTDKTHVTMFEQGSLGELARKSGFRKTEVYIYHYPFPFANWKAQPYKFLNWLRGLPVMREVFNRAVNSTGFPTHEFVLIAER